MLDAQLLQTIATSNMKLPASSRPQATPKSSQADWAGSMKVAADFCWASDDEEDEVENAASPTTTIVKSGVRAERLLTLPRQKSSVRVC